MHDPHDPWDEGRRLGGEPRPDPRKMLRRGGPGGDEISWAFMLTFFPILVLSLVSVFGFANDSLYFLWFIAGIYGGVAIGAGIILAIVALFLKRQDTAGAVGAGVVAGLALGVVALAITCFINLTTWDGVANMSADAEVVRGECHSAQCQET